MNPNSNQRLRRSGGVNLQTIIGILAGAYGVSPIDVIPDFIPIAGQADDTLVIILALLLMIVVTLADRNGGAE